MEDIGHDDGDDIDWEAGGDGDEEGIEIPTGTISVDMSEIEAQKAKKPPQKRYSKADYAKALDDGCLALGERLQHVSTLMAWSCNDSLQAILLSLLPGDLADEPASSSSDNAISRSRRVFAWLLDQFTVIASSEVAEDEGRDGSSPDVLEDLLFSRKAGTAAQISQLLHLLLLALRIRCRLLVLLRCPSLSPGQPALRGMPIKIWLEVFSEWDPVLGAGWTAFDPAGGSVGLDERMEAALRKIPATAMVLGAEGTSITDLSSRYISTVPHFPSQRLQRSYADLRKWLNDQLTASRPSAGKKSEEDGDVINLLSSDDEQDQEHEQLQQLQRCRALAIPTVLSAFRHHPVYALQRHLRSIEMLRPDSAAVGMFKGEQIYRRDDVQELRSKQQWRRLMRLVKPDEQALRMKKKRKRPSDEDGEGTGMYELKLYGSWQTIPLQVRSFALTSTSMLLCSSDQQVPPVVDGVLPRNKYGNIEVWDELEQYVPRGAAFIRSNPNSSAEKAARALGIDCVPAVTRFESRAGRAFPIIGGVVVLQDHAAVLLDAMFTLEGVHSEQAYHQQVSTVTKRWEHLVRSLLARQHLKETYGH